MGKFISGFFLPFGLVGLVQIGTSFILWQWIEFPSVVFRVTLVAGFVLGCWISSMDEED